MGINVQKRNNKYLVRIKGTVEVLTADELDELKFRIELANGDLPPGPEAYKKSTYEPPAEKVLAVTKGE